MNVNGLNLDVSKQPAVTPVLYLGQGDKNGTTLQASIYDDGVPLSLSGKSARFAMRSPNGQAYYEVNGTVSGNVATFQINEEYAASIAGTTDVAYVEVLEGSTVVCSTNRFRVVILESAQEGADPEQAYSNGIMEAIDDANEAADDAREAAEEAREAAQEIIPLMSPTQRGGAKLGAGLQVGTDERLGVKVDGSSIMIGQDGALHGSASITVDDALSSTSENPVQNKVIKQALDGKASSSLATQSANGLMAAADKQKLDGIEANANNYSLPTMSPTTKGGAKLGKGLSVEDDALNLGPLTDSGSGASVETDGCGIFGVAGEGFAHQDGTPTPDSPQEIRVARGRNLLDGLSDYFWYAPGGEHVDSLDYFVGSESKYPCNVGEQYVFSSQKFLNTIVAVFYDSSDSYLSYLSTSNAYQFSFVVPQGAKKLALSLGLASGTLHPSDIVNAQLELGSQATPYVPYGHIGLDITANGQTTTTPIPLPAKGFAGALPDGTKDTLAIDSAGRVEWVNVCNEAVFDGSSDEAWASQNSNYCVQIGVDGIKRTPNPNTALSALCSHFAFRPLVNIIPPNNAIGIAGLHDSSYIRVKWKDGTYTVSDWRSWLASNPVAVLYPLVTPTTESLGYIALPELPAGATVSIPELEAIGVEWWVEGAEAVAEHGRDVSKANKEQEDRIAELEAAVANLATS